MLLMNLEFSERWFGVLGGREGRVLRLEEAFCRSDSAFAASESFHIRFIVV